MSTKSHLFLADRRRRASGVALVITLALLVLVAVAVVAFMTRSTANQQITSSSSNGVTVDVFSNGTATAIIAGLQKEMWDGSVGSAATPPPTPAPGAPYLLPMTNNQAINPTRCLRPGTDGGVGSLIATGNPNDRYYRFANLVKQSAPGVPTYNIPAPLGLASGTANVAVSGPIIANKVKTSVSNPEGRSYNGTFWNKPELVSISSSTATAATDLEPLVPYWVYTDRTGTPATELSPAAVRVLTPGNTLNPKNIVGRYAYNIYDIGGTLNANVAGNALTSYPQTVAPTATSSSATEVVPGYKGSTFAADLSGLSLGGTLTYGVPATVVVPPDWSQLPQWRVTGSTWPTDARAYTGFGYLLPGGEFSGWLNDFFQPFDPATGALHPSATPLNNHRFTSRQDLINWVHSYWPKSPWVLPYLTHFSFDTDAPTYTPELLRPAVQPNENDSYTVSDNLTRTAANDINPGFIGPNIVDYAGHPVTGSTVTDANGSPIVKRRFPLSALALISNYGPANPPPTNGTLADQIKYDFGLVWTPYIDPTTGQSSPCWQYQDYEGVTSTIKRLSQIPKTRSPNFFELLKAAITVGSLGKQYGNTYDSNTDNALSTTLVSTRFGSTNCQVMQIGANIISQTSTNYTPCHINFGGSVNCYGVQDFPYIYRDRLSSYILGKFGDSAMQTTLTAAMTNPSLGANSCFEAEVLQPELWNPHAPNAVNAAAVTGYPKMFRIVPNAASLSGYCTYGGAPWTMGRMITDDNSNVQDYSGVGGPDTRQPLTYPGDGSVSISVQAEAPSASPSSLTSFREPCTLLSSNVPNGASFQGPSSVLIGNLSSYSLSRGASNIDLSGYGVNAVPSVFGTANGASTGNSTYGFLYSYFCGGPGLNGSSSGTIPTKPGGDFTGGTDQSYLSANRETGIMALELQYSFDGTNFYTYDSVGSAAPNKQHFNYANGGIMQWEQGTRVDPRTHRWGFMWTQPSSNYTDYTSNRFHGETAASNDISTVIGTNTNPSTVAKPAAALGSWYGTYAAGNPALGYAQTNQPPASSSPAQQRGGAQYAASTYYSDPDGIVRLGDGAYANGTYGLPMFMLGTALTGSTRTGPVADYDSRPVVLNRPFQSVAELGYVFRDTPFRSLDFFTPQSGDAALLDVFCAYGPDPYSYKASLAFETGLVAGHVNLNTAQVPVLAALLQGTAVETPTTNNNPLRSYITPAVADTIANAAVLWTHDQQVPGKGYFRNRSELVGRYLPATQVYYGFSFGDPANTTYQLTTELQPLGVKAPYIKQQRESVMRALADVSTTRTWNLLIDVVAQTGRLASNAKDFSYFVVSGERHLWVSVAIDRATGRVIKMQTEPVKS